MSLVAVAAVVSAYFWAPWPSDLITAALVVVVVALLFVMERLA